MKETASFVNDLFQGMPPGSLFCEWDGESKRSTWHSTPESLAESSAGKNNVYFGCGVVAENPGATRRATKATVAAIPGVWADIDVAGDGHKRKKYPPTMADAIKLLDALPHRPTYILNTGGGIHAWWLFHEDEPLVTTSEEGRRLAQALVYEVQLRLREAAEAKGWSIDQTHDLARVLRLPGTVRDKVDGRHVVSIAEHNEAARYSLEDWIECEALPTGWEFHKRGWSSASADISVDVQVNEKMEPPLSKLRALEMMEPKFAATIAGERKDFPDGSQSAYDQSAANFAVANGWTDEEAVRLVVWLRQEHKAKPKPDSYYLRTVAKARATMGEEATIAEAAEDLREAIADAEAIREESPGGHIPEDARRAIIAPISTLVGLEVYSVTRFYNAKGAPASSFQIESSKGTIYIADAATLNSRARFMAAVVDSCLHKIPSAALKKPADFDALVQGICDAAESVERAADSSPDTQIEEWLDTYLMQNRPEDLDACAPESFPGIWERLQRSGLPFIHQGHTYIKSGNLGKYIKTLTGEKVSQRDLSAMLRQAGVPEVRKRIAGKTHYLREVSSGP